MTIRPRHIGIGLGLLSLAGCATGDDLVATSTCHTSDGQYVGQPGCTISYSTSRTVTTTSSVTTVEPDVPAPTTKADDR